ncbi:coiled-coil domain-containing protein 33-like [Clupea harengus]|uniref:Coiled-coil domain-containing protein 33-like n=1 Tax=Clupea harengus TaxID=7950 RepID=A0A8M1KHJ1_CLUHA|nr:coiled-coil domain-containing protein 33-like [Clupea harengus]
MMLSLASGGWRSDRTLLLDSDVSCLVAMSAVLVLSVADSGSRELLAYYRFPVAHLRPFQHYHLELVQTHPAAPSGVRLYVSVVLQTSVLPRQPCFSFTGFEVLLEAMSSPLKNPAGPLLAVARVVADFDSYRDTILLRTPSVAGIAVTSIPFPAPPRSAFCVPPISAHGRPQVSPAGCPQERPEWSHSFLFLGRDCATVFTGGAALVMELYPTTTVMNSVTWHLRSPVGFCVVFLDQSLYRKLMSEWGQRGVRVPQLPLQGSHLQTTTGSTPSVSIVLRLIGSEANLDQEPNPLHRSPDHLTLPLVNVSHLFPVVQ